MLRNLLIAATIGGNVVLWSVAYVGYSRSGDEEVDPRTRRPVVIRSAQLQLLTINIPAWGNVGGPEKDMVPVTVTLTLTDQRRLGYVCRLTPKIQDSMMQFLHKYPPQRSTAGKLDFRRHTPHLLANTNKILRRQYALKVDVVEGAKAVGGGGSARFFKMRSCQLLAKPDPDAATSATPGAAGPNGQNAPSGQSKPPARRNIFEGISG